MRHLFYRWHEADEEDPLDFYHEADSNGNEVRRVEVFRGGRLNYISAEHETEDSFLTSEKIPTALELNSDLLPGCNAQDITQAEFETMWNRAVGAEKRPPE
jgi:uncharacterized membrane protein YebE (DUF533 family)